MKQELIFTADPIDEAALCRSRNLSGDIGAVVSFMGVVRGQEQGRAISALEYEAFEAMARHQCQRLFDHLGTQWPVISVRLVHRVGRVPVNEAAMWVEVTAAHRAEAFAACQWLIDELKRLVPIWKKPVAAP